MMELDIAKVIALVVLSIVSFIVGILPIKIRKISKLLGDKRETILSVIHCFGGGILFGTSFILVLPEIQLGLNSLNNKAIPLAELLLAAGFFFIYLIEELLAYLLPAESLTSHAIVFSEDHDENENHHPKPKHSSTPKPQHKSQLEPVNEGGMDTVDDSTIVESSARFDELSLNAITPSPEDPPAENSFTSFNPKYAGSINTSTQSMFPNYRPNVEASKIQRSAFSHGFHLPKFNIKPALPSIKKNLDKTDTGLVVTISFVESVSLCLLCIHAFIEGLIVGLGTSDTNLWQLFAVTCLHHWIISVNVGMEMSQGKSSRVLQAIFLLFFAISVAVGVGVGIGICSSVADNSSLHSNINVLIVKGVACGALMYVVIFEVMHFEKSKKNVTGMVQFGSILIGFIVTVLIKILSGDDEVFNNDEDFLNQVNSTDDLPAPIAIG